MEVVVERRSLIAGGVEHTTSAVIGSLEVSEIPLPGDRPAADERLTVAATMPILVRGTQRCDNLPMAIPIFKEREYHASGTYPLPDLQRNDLVATVINLAEEPARVVGQVYWQGGEVAVGPVEVGPGQAHRFDFVELAFGGEPDVLGRILPSDLSRATFKWLSQEGEAAMIGRLEVKPRDGTGGRYGFNCFGCCWEVPVGTVVPESVEFLPGGSASFQACVEYETCNGTMGPYPTIPSTINSPAPFNWTGSSVSASSVGYETLSFLSQENELKPSCQPAQRLAGGGGNASTCKQQLRKASNPQEFWDTSTACNQQLGGLAPSSVRPACYECCDKVASYWVCRRTDPRRVERDREHCRTNCAIDFFCS